jgi:hypothetical protein
MKELQELLKYTNDLVKKEPEKSSYWHYNKLVSKLEEAIDVIHCSTQLPDGMVQIDNAYIEDADDVGSYYVDGRYTKVFVLEKEFDNNKCITN